jgi:hypothetical protein
MIDINGAEKIEYQSGREFATRITRKRLPHKNGKLAALDFPKKRMKAELFKFLSKYIKHSWKGLYSTVHATPFLQQYLAEDKKLIQTGFQLFLTGRIGYHQYEHACII